MKGYKVSKDYKRLKVLLDKGYEVVCIDGDGCYVAWGNAEFYSVLRYEVIGKYITNEGFCRICLSHNIEFIEPTEI